MADRPADEAGLPPAIGLYGAGLLAPLTVSVLWSKLDKLSKAGVPLRLPEVVAMLGADAAFLLVMGGVLVALLRVSGSRFWRPAVAGLLHLLVLVALLASVFDHIFFVAQGEPLPGQMLAYAIVNAEMLRGVLRSKLTPWRAVALVAPFAAALLPLVLIRLMGRRSSRWPSVRLRYVALAWGVALALSFAASRLEVAADLRYLKRNAIVRLAHEALAADRDQPGGPVRSTEPARLELLPGRELRRYNVVLVILESARALSTTPYAPNIGTTPFLASIAAAGVRVEHAYATVPHTSKALVSILCGIDPDLSTAIHEARAGGVPGPCLAELLAAEGYATAFLQPAEEEFERRRGLVANFGFATFEGRESLPAGFEESSYFGYEDASLLAPALEWVDGAEAPFFLTLLTLTSHHDYKLPSGCPRRQLADTEPLNGYLNALAYTDRVVGDFFDGLAQRGLLDETLFVVVGDHGEAFGEHGRWEHDDVPYEEGVRVPLLLAGAGVERPGTTIGGLRSTRDVAPTIAEVLGLRIVGDRVSGQSLLSTPGHQTLFFSCWYSRSCMALRDAWHKTIYHFERRGPELFDVVRDPGESHNLLADSDVEREQVERDIQRLKAWSRDNAAVYRAHFEALALDSGQ